MIPVVRCREPTHDGGRPPSRPYIHRAVISWMSANTRATAVSHTFIAKNDGTAQPIRQFDERASADPCLTAVRDRRCIASIRVGVRANVFSAAYG